MGYNYIADTGTIVPDTSTVLSEVQQEFRNALGQDLNLDPNTPQGQLITAEVEARTSIIRNNAGIANQLNPNLATGVFLRSVGMLMAITDSVTSRSVCIDVAILGKPNSLLPAGSLAQNSGGVFFQSIDPIVLDGDGKGTVNFQALITGPIECPAHTLKPAQNIEGWAQADNPTDALLGELAMTDFQYRVFRQNALANQSNNTAHACYSKLTMLPGVKSLVVRENDESANATIEGLTLPPNSLWVCINDDGGSSDDIAQTLLDCKAPGCKWTPSLNGAGTPVQVPAVDPISGQTYTVTFVRSVPVRVWINVVLRSGTTQADLVGATEEALLQYATGNLNNEAGFVVGADVSPFDLAGAINSQIPGVFVRSVTVSNDGLNFAPVTLDINLWERATLDRADIDVTVE